MRSRIVFIVLAFALSALFLAGCTDKTKDNPTRPEIPPQGLTNWLDALQSFSIAFSTSMDPGYMVYQGYTPPEYDWLGGGGRPYPVLYLLSPFRGDERYYFEHGLAQIADRLLAEGKIQPMIIISIDGRSQLGGSFYTDSWQQGKYFSALINDETFYVDLFIDPTGVYSGTGEPYRGPKTLYSTGPINRVDDWFNTINDPKARAISGVGMGGYGAFSLAVNTDLFGSVSAINAPLDFDGTGSNGFLTVINEVMPAQWLNIDTTETGRVDTTYAADTSLTDLSMSLIVSASAAFSPHPINVQMDSVYVTERDQILIWGYTVLETLTDDLTSYLPLHSVHVPFNSTGGINPFIWNKWMEHNIQDMLEADVSGNAAHFSNDMDKLLIWSKDAEFHYDQQMNAFAQYLKDNTDTSKYTVMDFAGNGVLSGTADHFLYDLMDKILIFHSQHFGGVPVVDSSATMVSKSQVLNNGSDTTVISATFVHSDGPSVSDFTATFKIRRPDNTEMILVNNQSSGSGGLTITYNGNLTYTAKYVYIPANGAALGLYDLYFKVSDGTNIAVDDYDNNLDELEIVYSK